MIIEIKRINVRIEKNIDVRIIPPVFNGYEKTLLIIR